MLSGKCYILQHKEGDFRIEENAHHDNWDDAQGYYSKLVIKFIYLLFALLIFFLLNFLSAVFKYFSNFMQNTALGKCYVGVMKFCQGMVKEFSPMLSGQKILKLGKMALMK